MKAFQKRISLQWLATNFDLVIPAGKRLVIHEISGTAFMPAGVKSTSVEGPDAAQILAARTPAAVPDGQPQGEVDFNIFVTGSTRPSCSEPRSPVLGREIVVCSSPN